MCSKTIHTAYNNTPQTFTIDGGTVNVLGVQICELGCGVKTMQNGFAVRGDGFYRISYDVIFEATGAGTAEIQLYKDETPLPCSYSEFVTAAGGIYPMHIETIIPIRACHVVRPTITCRVSGSAGDVTHVCASVVRLA